MMMMRFREMCVHSRPCVHTIAVFILALVLFLVVVFFEAISRRTGPGQETLYGDNTTPSLHPGIALHPRRGTHTRHTDLNPRRPTVVVESIPDECQPISREEVVCTVPSSHTTTPWRFLWLMDSSGFSVSRRVSRCRRRRRFPLQEVRRDIRMDTAVAAPTAT